LHGQKIQGAFALVKIKNNAKSGNPWLLVKEKDEFVNTTSALLEPTSVLSKKTLGDVNKNSRLIKPILAT